MNLKKCYSLDHLIQEVRRKSPFYKNLYKNLGASPTLSDLPILSQEDFWKNNNFKNNLVCTEEIQDGVIFKSGGTTGAPKFSWFKKDEWESFTCIFGEGMSQLDLKKGDRVGNLFYSGEMYASFLFINKSLENSSLPLVQFPFAGHTPFTSLLNGIDEYQINVLMGVPTTLIQLAIFLESEAGKCYEAISNNIEKIFFGGESLFPDQENILRRSFKNLRVVSSIGYASVDAGHLGFCNKDYSLGEHGVFLESSIMEIVNEENYEVITSPLQVGKLVYTNLSRIGMPIIRYPVGDKAQWLEGFETKRFKLLGRSDEGARVGPVTITRNDIEQSFKYFSTRLRVDLFQLRITRVKNCDQLEICFSSNSQFSNLELESLKESFYFQRKMFKDSVSQGILAPVIFTQIPPESFERNPRTGKFIFVLDKRFKV